MSESNLSSRLTRRLKRHPHVNQWFQVENSVGAGTPDIYGETIFGPFWCELKHVHDYPARPTTPIRFHRYTDKQADRIRDIGKSGNVASWILIQVANDHWLFHWTKAHDLQLLQPRMWWEENKAVFWKASIDYDQLADMLGTTYI